jgi:antitoxin MazE
LFRNGGIALESVFLNGSSVEIIEEDGKIVILPPKNTLEELLSMVTSENKHTAIETGPSIGKEEW